MAGLLDSLFNPSLYGGQNGGLLDFLRNTQMQQNNYQPSDGFSPAPAQPTSSQAQPIMVGSNQMPRIGDAAQFDPGQVNIPQNAQSTQGQMPVMPQQAGPDLSERIGAGLMNFANAGGILPALAGGVSGLMTGQRTDRLGNANQTAQFLVTKGIDPVLAKTIAADPHLMRSVLPSLIGTGGQTDDIKEYQFAKREEPNLTFQQFMQRKRATTGEYGLTPIWGTGPDGKPAYIQPGKSGDARLATLPEGFQISRDPVKIEGPTGTSILDPQTRQVVQFIPKDVAGAAKQKAVGTAQGEAKAKLPAVLIDAQNTSKKIDELLAVPGGIDAIVGPIDQLRPSWTMGESGRNALARLEQLQGGAFLQAFNTLKGGGAITEAEGRKAEQAIARMQRSQSEADFRIALQDFRDAVNDGVRKLQASAGETGSYPAGIAASPQASAAPTSGSLPNGWSVRVR